MANEITERYEPEYGQRYRVLVDKIARTWKQLSFKTAAEDVYFSHNESETLESIIGVTYHTILPAGQSSCFVYTKGGYTDDSKIDVYTSKYGLSPINIIQFSDMETGRPMSKLEFYPQPENVDIKVVIGAFVDFIDVI